uniref:Uncharacterized protein n=2 Tax=Parascaris univalens TaxID=6257 RepID=A0A915B3A7_PARUN
MQYIMHANADVENVVEVCTIAALYEVCAGNSEHYVHFLVRATKGLICYTFAPVSGSLYSVSGFSKPYHYRFSICHSMCPSHNAVSIHSQKELGYIADAIEYFEKVSPKKSGSDPRHYDLGYSYEFRRWDDYSPPNLDLSLGDFFSRRGCHGFDLTRRQPHTIDCEAESSVVMCEHRCEDCQIDEKFLNKGD